jgi:hypothetical protein
MKRPESFSSVSFDAVKTRAVFSDVYKFVDVSVAMKSDKREMLDWFRRLYPRFRVEKETVDVTYYIMAEASEKPFVIAEENSHLKTRFTDDMDFAPSYAHLLAFNYIAANLKSHFLLHSAVVSRNGDGLALVGPSGSGKTALMLQLLLKKEFKYLSDDQLVINRTTHLADPYPRSIGIRENTLALFDGLELENREPQVVIGGQRKWFVDISEISENTVGKSCHLKHLVFLVNSLDKTETGNEQMELVVDDLNDELLEKLQCYAKGREIYYRHTRNCYALSFYPETEIPSALEFERLCQSCGVWLLDVRRLSELEPDFHAAPEIQQIPWHTATMELLKGLQNDFRSAPGQAFLELAELLEGVSFYKLSAGRLGEMTEYICNLE